MRILLALAIVLAGCSKKKDEPAPAPTPEPKTAESTKPPEPTPAPPKPSAPAPTADDDEKPTPTESAPPAAVASAPTKEAAIQRLKDVLAALEGKDWTKAAGYFAWPAAERIKSPEAALGTLIDKQEISAKGIEILAAKAKWGKLADVIDPKTAASDVERYAVPLDECYGFKLTDSKANATVGFHWDGTELKVIRLNNVGKLE